MPIQVKKYPINFKKLEEKPTEDNKQKLPSLNQFNKKIWEEYKAANIQPKPNGIACNECNTELHDISGIEIMSKHDSSNIHHALEIPVVEVKCPECQKTSFRLSNSWKFIYDIK